MDTNFIYSKLRSEFGKQCLFFDAGPQLIDNYPTDKRCRDRYVLRDPTSKGTNLEPLYALHEANTEVIEYKSTMVSHMEGGWPKDTAFNDLEQTERYRRKAMKDDSYIQSVLSLSVPIEACITQNNAVNIYQSYYSDVAPTPFVEQNNCRTINVYKMPGSNSRPITNISWSPSGTHLAATHCDVRFQCPEPVSNNCYIWELENPNSPDIVLTPDSPMYYMEYNTKDSNLLCGGFMTGQVGYFDLRRGTTPVMICPIELAHRDPCNQLHWIASKTNSEFFSSSTDGSVKWWDTRNNLTENIDVMIMDLSKNEEPSYKRAIGISVLEYESTMPTKFMFGTETGKVMIINRKGKTIIEKVSGIFNAHLGPVYSLQRNTAFFKNFLTIGDWTARIWAEDVRESCIVWTAFHKCFVRDACWSTARYSLFFTVRDDGIMDCWDVLQQQYAPIYSMKVSDTPLRKVSCNAEGKMVALGTLSGTIYLIEVSDSMVQNTARDKPFLTAMFERESRREKILEARTRELRLLKATARAAVKEEDAEIKDDAADNAEVAAAEEEYMAEVQSALAAYSALEEGPKETSRQSKSAQAGKT